MCQLLVSGIGYVPTSNVHTDVWNHVESYTIYMFLVCRLKITFTFSLKLIISILVQLQHLLLPSLIVTSSQVRVGTSLPLWSCCISGLGPEGLCYGTVVWFQYGLQVIYLGWPLRLHRGNSAFKNLQRETQWQKCCLYKTPYVAAPVRETGDIITRSLLYAWPPTYAPTRARIIFGSGVTFFLGDPSCWKNGSYVPFLQGSHMQKQYHQRTTLRTWEPWRMQERDAEWLALTIAHHIHGTSVPLEMTVAQRYDLPWDLLWDACHMAGVC